MTQGVSAGILLAGALGVPEPERLTVHPGTALHGIFENGVRVGADLVSVFTSPRRGVTRWTAHRQGDGRLLASGDFLLSPLRITQGAMLGLPDGDLTEAERMLLALAGPVEHGLRLRLRTVAEGEPVDWAAWCDVLRGSMRLFCERHSSDGPASLLG